uniref:Uncharacterized protein n=1 Tax=Ditylenchus dipsaci TaxID=166011 RepID=A0A915D2J8_9BILA
MQRPNRAIGCKRLATLLQNFVELKGHELIERKFLFNFISHCAVLQKQGFINHHEIQKFYTSPFEQRKLRRSPRKNWLA